MANGVGITASRPLRGSHPEFGVPTWLRVALWSEDGVWSPFREPAHTVIVIARRSGVLLAHRSVVVGRQSPGWALSLAVRVWFGRAGLDRELAEGANPNTDPARWLRARQLSSRRCRRELAAGLRWLVTAARRPTRAPWVVVAPLDCPQVRGASELMLMLAARLEDIEEPGPRAAALASFLVHDPLSPVSLLFEDVDGSLSSSGRGATTAQLARAALEAIDQRPLR
jgi:hypothetical protein